MKKLFIICAALFLLSACGGQKIDKNIDDKMAEDAMNILDMMDAVVKEKRDLTEREKAVMDDFQLLYGGKEEIGELNEQEDRLYIKLNKVIDMKDSLLYVESNKDSYKTQRRQTMNVIEHGTIYDD